MKIFTRYVLKRYSCLTAFILVALSSVYTLILFFEVLDDALENRSPMTSVLHYLFYSQARVMKEMIPLAFFFATLAYVVMSNKNFELVVLRALGVKSSRALIPMAILAGVVGCFMTFWNLNVAPWGISKSTEIRKVEIKKEKETLHLRYTNLWVKSGNTACFIHFFDERKRIFRNMRCIWFQNGKIQSLAMAPQTQWEGGKWQMVKPTLITIEGGTIKEKTPPLLPVPLDITPQNLLERKKGAWEMTYGELRDYIRAMEREGYSVPHLKEELYQRVSMAFTPLVLVLLVFPIATRPPREGGWKAIVYALGALVAYWGGNSIFVLLGREGWVPPLLATLLPPLAATGGVLWFLKKKEG